MKSNDCEIMQEGSSSSAVMYKCIYCISMLKTKHEMVDHIRVVHEFTTQGSSLASTNVSSSGDQDEYFSRSFLGLSSKKTTFKPPLLKTTEKVSNPVISKLSCDSSSKVDVPPQVCEQVSNGGKGKVLQTVKSRGVQFQGGIV